MRKAILFVSLAGFLMMVNSGTGISQDKPKPKKDTVNMDTYAKPTFYYAADDDKATSHGKKNNGSTATIIMIAGAVVIAGVTGFFLLKKKKN
jgi:LPXTG-motif cell wall-anchored protein